MSHLTRGAWIEINNGDNLDRSLVVSHLTRGAWIEIAVSPKPPIVLVSRTSHEVRGLKL